MAKVIEPRHIKRCTGCELCVFEIQRQMEKIGLEGSFVRVFRSTDPATGETTFAIETDPRVHSLDIEALKNSCPNAVFEIVEMEDESK